MRRSVIRLAWRRGGAAVFVQVPAQVLALALAVALAFTLASPVCAKQKNKKKKSDSANPVPMPAMPVVQQINGEIGQMLGAFQLGDVETMHKYYADNATFVSGVWAPPVVGWANYVPLYKREWSAYQGIQLIRKNTYVFAHEDVAWASYQWEFDATLNGEPFQARGQTTLIFNKVGDNWLIVHNHTSEICQVCPVAPSSQSPTAKSPTAAQPARP